jgi:hypothetical protein
LACWQIKLTSYSIGKSGKWEWQAQNHKGVDICKLPTVRDGFVATTVVGAQPSQQHRTHYLKIFFGHNSFYFE